MKTVVKLRWLILALWIAAAAALAAGAPDMAALVRDKGQITLPEGYSSSVAGELLAEFKASGSEGESEKEISAVLVFHRDEGLRDEDWKEIERGIGLLKEGRDTYGITSVLTHFDNEELKEQFAAEDGRTVLAIVNAAADGRTAAELRDDLYEALAGVNVEHYYTAEWLINEDVIQSSQDGLHRTEWITVILLLVILLIVFRSFIAPLIPLLTVGISYLVSQSVVAYLVDWVDFPLSNFTQIFLVAVLFGIGTDYCILLISRFKEELSHDRDRTEAIVETYRTAGKTVLYAGAVVLIGFASIGLSAFSLYRSAVAVAVGIAVMLLALVTLVPFFMAVLGKAIFWPFRGKLEHRDNALWGAVGRFSLRRPLWALVLIAVLAAPFLAAYQGLTSFNSLEEIGDKYNSVKAFNAIADSFGPGESMPAEVVVKAKVPLDTQQGMAAIERVSRELMQVDGVSAVRSAARPTGSAPDDFRVANQMETVGSGLSEGEEALGQIGEGLSEASRALGENAPKLEEAAGGVSQLIAGTNELKQGVVQLGDALKAIESGLKDGSKGASELAAGMKQAQDSAEQLAAGAAELQRSYEQLGGGLQQLKQAYGEAAKQATGLSDGLARVGQGLSGIARKYPDLQSDEDFIALQGAVSELEQGASHLGDGLAQLNEQLSGVASGLNQANAGFRQASAGQAELAKGLRALTAGIGELQRGIARAADGQGRIVGEMTSMTNGFDQMIEGQKELQDGFAELNGQLEELTKGLTQSADGLLQIKGGLSEAGSYLNGLAGERDNDLSGWYLPDEALQSEQFRTILDTYMSADRTMTTFQVVLDGNPYDERMLGTIDLMKEAVKRGIKDTPLEGAEIAVGGVSSMNNDLSHVSGEDYSRTVVVVIAAISLILILLFRSVVIPIYVMLSLLLTFFTSMAVTEAIFVHLLGYSGISWAVPFFGFVMLMALGVDYSIFLMGRFKEYRHLPPGEAILTAMKKMGGVIISAAVILGGTFAAMLPSGVLSLLQIATIVLVGLFLYALVMLPLFIPVMVRTFGEANWWPFMRSGERLADESPAASGRTVQDV